MGGGVWVFLGEIEMLHRPLYSLYGEVVLIFCDAKDFGVNSSIGG